MNSETLIRKEADNFKNTLEYDYKHNHHLQVKRELESMLFNYDEKVDKLIFLYQTLNNIEGLLSDHNLDCPHKNDPETCVENVYYETLKFFTEQEIRKLNPSYEFSILRPNINSTLIKQNLISLETHPKTAKIYLAALDKINQASYQRNLLDDLRLTLEILLKDLLQNEKPLEKQKEDIGKYLKTKNVSSEVSNMFVILQDYFGKYQNSYVKHDDNVNKHEIELMINLTSTFVNFLLNI
jgi:hypothetical protein